jgi:hypothetical protein
LQPPQTVFRMLTFIVLYRPNQEYRNISSTHNLHRDTAGDPAPQSAAPMGRHHDQIDVLLPAGTENLFSGSTAGELCPGP